MRQLPVEHEITDSWITPGTITEDDDSIKVLSDNEPGPVPSTGSANVFVNGKAV